MKKSLFLSLIVILFAIISCQKTEEKSACEKNNTGFVKIVNNLSYSCTVDIWDGNSFYGERTLYSGGSTTYNNVSVGTIKVWESDPYSSWGYYRNNPYVTKCGTTTVTISSYSAYQNIVAPENKSAEIIELLFMNKTVEYKN